jgi:hypothetical protein
VDQIKAISNRLPVKSFARPYHRVWNWFRLPACPEMLHGVQKLDISDGAEIRQRRQKAAFASNLRLSAQEKWAGIDNDISGWTLAPSLLVCSAVAVATGNQ